MPITKRRITLMSEPIGSVANIAGIQIGITPTWIEEIEETSSGLMPLGTSPATATKIITPSMYEDSVVYFPMSEGAGNTIENIVPAYEGKNNGVLYGASWVWDDAFGYALKFVGNGDINLGDDASLYTSGAIMIETVLTLNSLNRMQVIFDQLTGKRTGAIQLRINRSNKIELIRCRDGTNNMHYVESQIALEKDVLYYLVAGYDGTNYKMYINNGADVSGTPYTTRYPKVEDIDRTYRLYATVRSFGMYPRVLPADEKKQHYELSLLSSV